jgi:hypothetical protein
MNFSFNKQFQNNYFKNYSIQGSSHPRSYWTKVEAQNRTYGFVALDTSLIPGPKKPFNYFGSIFEDDEELKVMMEKVEDQTDYHFAFGHYPLR